VSGLIVFLIGSMIAAVAIGAWTFARVRARSGRRW
jgi:uncharacterized protein (DUF697 family)